jgi:hypothetical protein
MPENEDRSQQEGELSERKGRLIPVENLEGHPLGRFVEIRMAKKMRDVSLHHIPDEGALNPRAAVLRVLTHAQARARGQRYHVPTYEVSVPMNRTPDIINAIAEGSLCAEDMLRASKVGALTVVIGDDVNLYEYQATRKPPYSYFQFAVISGHATNDTNFKPSPSMAILMDTPSVVQRLNLDSARPWDIIAATMASGDLRDGAGAVIDSPEKLCHIADSLDMPVHHGKLNSGLSQLSSIDAVGQLIKAGKLNASELSEYYAHIAELQRQNVRQNMSEIQKRRKRKGPLFNADRDIPICDSPGSSELQDVPLGYLISLTDAFLESLVDKAKDIQDGFSYEPHSLIWQGNLFFGFVYTQIARALERGHGGALSHLDKADLQEVVSPIQKKLAGSERLTPRQLTQIERIQGYFGASQEEMEEVMLRIRTAVDRKEPMGVASNIVLNYVRRRCMDIARLIGYYSNNPRALDRTPSTSKQQEPESGMPTLDALVRDIRGFGGNPKSLGSKLRGHDPRVF